MFSLLRKWFKIKQKEVIKKPLVKEVFPNEQDIHLAVDVAKFFINKFHDTRTYGDNPSMSKLQFMLYYSQAFNLAFHDKPLFVEEIHIDNSKRYPYVKEIEKRYRELIDKMRLNSWYSFTVPSFHKERFSEKELEILEDIWRGFTGTGRLKMERMWDFDPFILKCRKSYREYYENQYADKDKIYVNPSVVGADEIRNHYLTMITLHRLGIEND